MTDIPAVPTLNEYPPPTVPEALDNIPDGEDNLLPIDILKDDLRVEVPRWSDDAEHPETLELYWDNVKVAEKTWPGTAPDHDLFIMLPASYLREGVHVLRYRVINELGNPAYSQPINVTIDTTEPFYPGNPPMLRFPTEVEVVGITRNYLDRNDNKVEATLPSYDVRPGDYAEFHWETGGPFGNNLVMTEDVPADRKVYFDGDMIEDEGNGDRVASFYLYDRAGNRSKLSVGRTVKVNIVPPEPRPFPWVVGAEPGNPASIDPVRATGGLTVRVPEQTDIADSSAVKVHWEGFGEMGSYVVASPITVGGWDFKIPALYIPPNFLREVKITYSVEFPEGEPEISETYTLRILANPTTKIGCTQSSGGKISLAAIPAAGADLTLPPWAFKPVAAGMRVNIWMTGIDNANQPVREDVLTGEPVPTNTQPVTARMRRAAFDLLQLNKVFRLHAAVSFDDGERYIDFQPLDLNLTA